MSDARCTTDRGALAPGMNTHPPGADTSLHSIVEKTPHGLAGQHPEGIGVPVLRREDRRFIEGQGRYVADLDMPGQWHCAFVRSPHAHARVSAIDVSAALACPGVTAVLTGADMAHDGVGPMIPLWQIPGADGTRMNEPPHHALARGTVRYVGEAVALVLAATQAQAQDAAEQVAVTWEPLAAVVDVRDALAADALQLHPEAVGNLCVRFVRGAVAPVDAAFAQAAHVARVDIVNQRLICVALEPRAVIALPSASRGLDGHELTLWSATQVPHQIRKFVAEALQVRETAVRVIAPDVGGGFGTKGKLYPEEVILAWAARRLQRPLKWVATRSESFLGDYQGRGHVTHAELALDAGGRFLALRVNTLADMGAWVSTVGAAIPTTVYTALLSGPYRIPAIQAEVRTVFTNTVPTDAYRGAGRPEACFVLERLVEQAARQTGIDRIALRRRNFIPVSAMPYATPIGPIYDSGNFVKLFDRALLLADYDGFEARREAARARGMLRGFGVCYFVESSGVGPSKFAGAFGSRAGLFETATIHVAADGSLQVLCGTHSHGQGHATSFAQVLASKIGVPLSMIELIEGDTGRVPMGAGTFGSRSMVIAGSAISVAANKVINKAKRMAAHLLEAAESDIEHQVAAGEGRFTVAGTDRSVGWREVAGALSLAHNLPAGLEPGLHEQGAFDPVNMTWSNGAQACELEVDAATGAVRIVQYIAVDDVGTVINPMIVAGQVHGATAQGIGQALLEAAIHDRQSGQPLTGSLMDYALPRAGTLKGFLCETDQSQPCTHNPLGAKGAGESGTIGAPAAIASAMLDALAPVGVRDLEMPYTAARVWRAIARARAVPRAS